MLIESLQRHLLASDEATARAVVKEEQQPEPDSKESPTSSQGSTAGEFAALSGFTDEHADVAEV